MNKNEIFASFWEHIEELRRTILKIFGIVMIAIFISFLFYEPLITFFKTPLLKQNVIEKQAQKIEYYQIRNSDIYPTFTTISSLAHVDLNLSKEIKFISKDTYEILPQGVLIYFQEIPFQELVILGPLDGILSVLKICIWVGVFISSPLWLFVLFQFFIPGMYLHEKRLILPFISISLIFIAGGCLFAYYLTLPIANQYFIAFNESIGKNLWSLSQYLDYTLFLILANGLSFELGVIGIFAIHLGWIQAEKLIAYRRFAILSAFIIAAILTPPDIITQVMLAIPLCGLYEILIIYAKLREANKSLIDHS